MKTSLKIFIIVFYASIITASEIGLIYFNNPTWFLTVSIASSVLLFFILGWFGWLKLDEKSLLRQPLFLVSILLPIHLFLMYGFWAWAGKEVNFSADGFSHFIDISKLPLLLLASSAPMAAIVNNIHRTIQTEKQILEAQHKNIQDAHINHRKFHLELYSKIEGKNITEDITSANNKHTATRMSGNYKLHVKYPLELYRKSYYNSNARNENNSKINENFIESLKRDWVEINNQLKKIHQPADKNARTISYKSLETAYVKTCKNLCLGGYHSDHSFIFNDYDSDYQLFSMFFKFNTIYKCILTLETVTHSYLDTCYGEEVKKYFTLDEPLVKIGPGIYHDWLTFLDYVAMGDYSETKLVRLSTFESVETGDILAAEH